jgi:hypothetical protein
MLNINGLVNATLVTGCKDVYYGSKRLIITNIWYHLQNVSMYGRSVGQQTFYEYMTTIS